MLPSPSKYEDVPFQLSANSFCFQFKVKFSYSAAFALSFIGKQRPNIRKDKNIHINLLIFLSCTKLLLTFA